MDIAPLLYSSLAGANIAKVVYSQKKCYIAVTQGSRWRLYESLVGVGPLATSQGSSNLGGWPGDDEGQRHGAVGLGEQGPGLQQQHWQAALTQPREAGRPASLVPRAAWSENWGRLGPTRVQDRFLSFTFLCHKRAWSGSGGRARLSRRHAQL